MQVSQPCTHHAPLAILDAWTSCWQLAPTQCPQQPAADSSLMLAVIIGQREAAPALLAAAPGLALQRIASRQLPLRVALGMQQLARARCLLERGALPPAADVQEALEAPRQPMPGLFD